MVFRVRPTLVPLLNSAHQVWTHVSSAGSRILTAASALLWRVGAVSILLQVERGRGGVSTNLTYMLANDRTELLSL